METWFPLKRTSLPFPPRRRPVGACTQASTATVAFHPLPFGPALRLLAWSFSLLSGQLHRLCFDEEQFGPLFKIQTTFPPTASLRTRPVLSVRSYRRGPPPPLSSPPPYMLENFPRGQRSKASPVPYYAGPFPLDPRKAFKGDLDQIRTRSYVSFPASPPSTPSAFLAQRGPRACTRPSCVESPHPTLSKCPGSPYPSAPTPMAFPAPIPRSPHEHYLLCSSSV